MPSVYRLACDKIEQALAILHSELWHDERSATLMRELVDRLLELDEHATAQPSKPKTLPSCAPEGANVADVVLLRTRRPADF